MMVLSMSALAAEPRIEVLVATCAGCHGHNGSSQGPAIPTISGISYGYFVLSMEEYRKGLRNSTIMKRIALGYNWTQIKEMAAYFSKQPFGPLNTPYDRTRARRGKALHMKYCEQCHLRGGRDSGSAGVLSGQMQPYLRMSLKDMMAGKRPMPDNMRKWMDRLFRIEGEDAIDDLMHYYASRRVY